MQPILLEKLASTSYFCVEHGVTCNYCSAMTIHTRIKQRRLALGLSMDALAKLVGVKSWQTIQQWEKEDDSGGTAPKRVRLKQVADALLVTQEWLSTGNDGDKMTSPSTEKYAQIPRYTVRASAGTGVLIDHEEIQDTIAFRRDWLTKNGLSAPNLRVIYASGESMSPRIQDGDVLLIDVSDREIKDGKAYAIQNGELRVKRLFRQFDGQLVLRSDNKDFPDEIAPYDAISVIGRVAWVGGGM